MEISSSVVEIRFFRKYFLVGGKYIVMLPARVVDVIGVDLYCYYKRIESYPVRRINIRMCFQPCIFYDGATSRTFFKFLPDSVVAISFDVPVKHDVPYPAVLSRPFFFRLLSRGNFQLKSHAPGREG